MSDDGFSLTTVFFTVLILSSILFWSSVLINYELSLSREINLKINDTIQYNGYYLELVTLNGTHYDFNIWIKNGDKFDCYQNRTVPFDYKTAGIYPIGREEFVLTNGSGSRDGPFILKAHIDGGFYEWLLRF